jgi:hypothetical protein
MTDIESSVDDEEWLEYISLYHQGDVEMHSKSQYSLMAPHETESFPAENSEEKSLFATYFMHFASLIMTLLLALILLIITYYYDQIIKTADCYIFVTVYAFCCFFRSNKAS